MHIAKQLALFLENRPGMLARVCEDVAAGPGATGRLHAALLGQKAGRNRAAFRRAIGALRMAGYDEGEASVDDLRVVVRGEPSPFCARVGSLYCVGRCVMNPCPKAVGVPL